jgi:hypothetical protein
MPCIVENIPNAEDQEAQKTPTIISNPLVPSNPKPQNSRPQNKRQTIAAAINVTIGKLQKVQAVLKPS